ncbi:hypothetical protein ACYOEI_29900, partial [Singulisphaera rosea]
KRLSAVHRSGKALIRGLVRLKPLLKGPSLGLAESQEPVSSARIRQDLSAQEAPSRRVVHAGVQEGRVAGRR